MFDPTLARDQPQTLAMQTRKGGLIANFMNPAEPLAGIQFQIADLKIKHPTALHRDVGPSAMYNCHGLTFAARRTGINDSAQVQRILLHDGYTLLQLTQEPMPGDIAIYREDGDITHSGIVMFVRSNSPWILGKWGDCHEVVHEVRDCPYGVGSITYYRLMK